MLELLSRGRAIVQPANNLVPMALPPVQTTGMDTQGLHLEHLSIETEVGERCPLLLVRDERHAGFPLRPVFIMHGTNGSKRQLLENGFLQRVARMGKELSCASMVPNFVCDGATTEDRIRVTGAPPMSFQTGATWAISASHTAP